MNGGPSKYYPAGDVKFDDGAHRIGAGLAIIQWQFGVAVTIYPDDLATAKPIWPKKRRQQGPADVVSGTILIQRSSSNEQSSRSSAS